MMAKEILIRKDLPEELQSAPIFSFAYLPFQSEATYLATGNFYGVLPYEGRYDALNPTIFNYNKKSSLFKSIEQFPSLDGEFRDAKWMNYSGGKKILVVARNNNQLIFLKS